MTVLYLGCPPLRLQACRATGGRHTGGCAVRAQSARAGGNGPAGPQQGRLGSHFVRVQVRRRAQSGRPGAQLQPQGRAAGGNKRSLWGSMMLALGCVSCNLSGSFLAERKGTTASHVTPYQENAVVYLCACMYNPALTNTCSTVFWLGRHAGDRRQERASRGRLARGQEPQGAAHLLPDPEGARVGCLICWPESESDCIKRICQALITLHNGICWICRM